MNRSGFNDDCDDDDPLATGRWRAAVNASLRGKRGQAFLRELLAALDAMPDKRLIADAAVADGCMCTLAVVAAKRGVDLERLDYDMQDWAWDRVAATLGISESMAREVMYINDEHTSVRGWVRLDGPPDRWNTEPEAYLPLPDVEGRRWQYMRDWVANQIRDTAPSNP